MDDKQVVAESLKVMELARAVYGGSISPSGVPQLTMDQAIAIVLAVREAK